MFSSVSKRMLYNYVLFMINLFWRIVYTSYLVRGGSRFTFQSWTYNNRSLKRNFTLTKHKHFLFFVLTLYPPADAFWHNSSRRLLKTLWPKVKLLMMNNFSFGRTVVTFIYQLSYIFRFLSLCFQSRLLQNCCMWERG